ncbi:hypothetical protein Y032_0008g86 [Ancylostoma ceylanicum]|uniref:Uncharacterized protein n=1 Tax=Ancylostoma ceylanicum TaxID=53326 RepID=A0A016VLX2_9BILA|nr:hypothetical protein Y032_0008g86 [Ancylostoma ceylanicum]
MAVVLHLIEAVRSQWGRASDAWQVRAFDARRSNESRASRIADATQTHTFTISLRPRVFFSLRITCRIDRPR